MDLVKLKNFKIQSTIGSGGFGRVLLVKNKKDKKEYAAKVSFLPLNDKSSLNISREVNILAKIDHPSILKLISFSQNDFEGNPYPTFILEYASNGSLSQILEKERRGLAPKEWDDTKKYINIFGIAYGMSFLHKNNIIHRDLKPDNVMEDEYLLPKIGDFGLSKIYDPKQRSKQSMVGGTLSYMAPEMFLEDHYNNSVDVYAYSIILFEITTGEEPYKELINPNMIQIKVSNGYRPQFPKGLPISSDMEDLINRCWSQNPSDRPNFEEIVEILKDPQFMQNSQLNVDESDFLSYLDYVEAEKNSFDSKKSNVFNIESFIKNKKTTSIRKVISNDNEEPPKKSIFSFFSKKKDQRKAQTDIQELKKGNNDKNEEQPKPPAPKPSPTPENKKPKQKITIYPLIEYQKLSKSCQELVQEAEGDDIGSLISLIFNLIEGKNSFPQNVQIAIKYLNHGISKSCVECMELYGTLLLEGKKVPKNESKGLEILSKAASKFNSEASKLSIAKHIMSKEDEEDEVNYYLAKKYAKDVADNGNVEAIVLYGKLCERNANNKYGKVVQNFEEAFKYFKLAADQGDPEGMYLYALYCKNPHGLFTPNIEEYLKYSKMSADKNFYDAVTCYGADMLEGRFIEQNLNEGMRLLNLAMKNDNLYAYYAYGFYLLYGINGFKQDEKKGLSYIKKAATGGCTPAQYEVLWIAEKYPVNIDTKKLRNKLIQKGRIFFDRDSQLFFDINYCFHAAVEEDKNNVDESFKILQKGIDINCVSCMIYYAELLKDKKRISEAKKMFKKAADFGDIEAIKEYVYTMEKGELGKVDPLELSKYKELISILSFD